MPTPARHFAAGLRLAGAALVALGGLGCGRSSEVVPAVECTPTGAPATSGVVLEGYLFLPTCLRVSVGEAVTFLSDDADVHTVTANAAQPEAFDSGPLVQGAAYWHTFTIAGTYQVGCSIHGGAGTTIFVAP